MADRSLAGVSGVYEIVNTTNGKRYIGSAVSFYNRFHVHLSDLRSGKHRNRHLLAAWRKYGEEAFTFRPLLICAPRDNVFFEQRAMDAFKPEYNLAPVAGSCLGVKHTDEMKAKVSARHKGNKYCVGRKMSALCLARIKEANRARKGLYKRNADAVAATAAAHRGMKRSPETRAKIAAKAKGRKVPPRSQEYRAAMSERLKGRVLSPEHMAAFQAGRAARVYTAEDRAKIGERTRAAYASGAISRERSEEYRAKIAASLTGRKATAEHRANQAAAQRGKKRGPYNVSPVPS